MKVYTVEMEFTTLLLGTAPSNPELYTQYVYAKKEEEASENGVVDTLDAELGTLPSDALERGGTGFHKDEKNRPFVYDYQVIGFFKDACSMLRRVPGTHSSKLTAYKKVIDGLLFIFPREIRIETPHGQGIGMLERPLRAQTPQGERVALTRSETAPEGSMISFDIEAWNDKDLSEAQLREWLDYGSRRGLGQWRNAGWGRFAYSMKEAPPVK